MIHLAHETIDDIGFTRTRRYFNIIFKKYWKNSLLFGWKSHSVHFEMF